jgi:hypothetical protein
MDKLKIALTERQHPAGTDCEAISNDLMSSILNLIKHRLNAFSVHCQQDAGAPFHC